MGAAHAVFQGRTAFNRHLFKTADIDVTTLPYDARVLDDISRWRARGGRVALLATCDEALARQIADHLKLFDEVHAEAGSARRTDNKAPASPLNDPNITRNGRTELANTHRAHPPALRSFSPYLKAMRPHQWLKNALLFVPVMTAHQFDAFTILTSLLAFFAFCAVASSVYLLNDLLDLKYDRAHPRKRNRPFASGAVPIHHGTWMALGLFAVGIGVALTLGGAFTITLCAYYVATLAYSLDLKRRVIADICVLAGLYTMRIVAGAAATGIPLSVWLLAFAIFLFFSLAAVKRLAELVDSPEGDKLSARGRGYKADDLPLFSQMALASGYVSVLVMALYVNSPGVTELYSHPASLWGICLVLFYWISRMVLVTHRGNMHDDPIVYAARNRVSQLCLIAIIGFTLGASLL